jgi:hypothetical protein
MEFGKKKRKTSLQELPISLPHLSALGKFTVTARKNTRFSAARMSSFPLVPAPAHDKFPRLVSLAP